MASPLNSAKHNVCLLKSGFSVYMHPSYFWNSQENLPKENILKKGKILLLEFSRKSTKRKLFKGRESIRRNAKDKI